MDNEATLTGSRTRLKSDSTFHIKTWYSTPSISCRDYEVLVDSEEIKNRVTLISKRIRWEDSLVSMTEKESSQKDWYMDFSVRLEGKSVLTSKIDLTDQACYS
jgi:hypothetical protein